MKINNFISDCCYTNWCAIKGGLEIPEWKKNNNEMHICRLCYKYWHKQIIPFKCVIIIIRKKQFEIDAQQTRNSYKNNSEMLLLQMNNVLSIKVD